MRTQVVRCLFISAISFSALACTKGVPSLEDLGLQMKGFWFSDGQDSATFDADASGLVSITGNCDSRIQFIKISFDAGTTWTDASGTDTDCSDGTFALSVPMTAVTALVGAFSMPARKDFRIQGITKLGKTKQASVLVRYGSAGSNGAAIMIARADKTTANGYRVIARIGQPVSGKRAVLATGASVKPGLVRQ
ncbi:MAG TPA: hypothetical protein VFV50_19475 [Bdellovibrionales bacterium]|nr:hypothetical protein [Bdellovibrionales bacterium]